MKGVVDIVLRQGVIVDGSGEPRFVGDLAVDDGVIVGIGRSLRCKGRVEEDCEGLLITPGWVDIHTHLEAFLSIDPALEPFSSCGVTTCIAGNCGVGFAPCPVEHRRFLLQLMEGVEDIPLGTMEQAIDWRWQTFEEFLGFIRDLESQKQLGIDFGVMVGHAPIRVQVLGERANLSDKPGGPKTPVTKKDIEAMGKEVEKAIKAGAMGFSTSRTLLHRDKSGVLVPGTLSASEELIEFARAMKRSGGGIFEMASDFCAVDDIDPKSPEEAERLQEYRAHELEWMMKVSKDYVPLNFCLGDPTNHQGKSNKRYETMLQFIEAARDSGCNISAQVFTRPQGIIFLWESRSHPFIESTTFVQLRREAKRAGRQIDKKLLAQRDVREQIIKETLALIRAEDKSAPMGVVLPNSSDDDDIDDMSVGNLNGAVTGSGALAKMMANGACWVYRWSASNHDSEEGSVQREADRKGVHPLEVIYDWMLERNGTQVLTYYFMNFSNNCLDDTHAMLMNVNTIPGLGDAGAHAGFLVDTTSHTFMLTHWARDKKTEPKFTVEEVVKMQTKDTAHKFGLVDRGQLKVGLKADINVIDFANLSISAPELVADLPNKSSELPPAERFIQRASGYKMTILSGVITHRNDKPTGQRNGKLVKNPGGLLANLNTSGSL